MNVISLLGVDIPYNITKKTNKHTYFYFKKAGYVQINMAKAQSISDIKQYMEQHAKDIVHKYQVHCISTRDSEQFYVWGTPFSIHKGNHRKPYIDTENQMIDIGIYDIDHYKISELKKSLIHMELSLLMDKHKSSPYVDISGIVFSIRSMVSRFGSCNKQKRRITINLELIHFDKKYLEYVFLHEIAHLVQDNHSKEYYQLLEKLCPNYKTLRAELKAAW